MDYSYGQGGYQDTADHPAEHGNHIRHMDQRLPNDSHKLPPYYSTAINPAMSCDIKPRLTKEQHDILEAHFQKQNKPNTNTKKGFAENLGVSLDKVNNWFQNRRAKSKQDAKKAQSEMNLYPNQQLQPPKQPNPSSDAAESAAFAPADYMSTMEQSSAGEHCDNGLPTIPMPQPQQKYAEIPFQTMQFGDAEQYSGFDMPQHMFQMSHDVYDSPREMHRRTMTQDQFDAIQQVGILTGDDSFSVRAPEFNFLNHEFAVNADMRPQDAFAFPPTMVASLSSHDSTIPSNVSEQSFPSDSHMQDRASMSTNGSEWRDNSRCPSVAGLQPDDPFTKALGPHAPATTTSQWQPGSSVPVDFKALDQEFEQIPRRAQSTQSIQAPEQPLACPDEDDEAFAARRGSQASMLAQHFDNVGLHTPHPPQGTGSFKSPAPPAIGGLAARRQRPRPADLSLRSRSYGPGGVPPGSPGHISQNGLVAGQDLRRIKSSNFVNGIAQGRVQKGMPGSAQRSPLSWTFQESVNSPKALRHGGSLAPPTPLSPHEFPRAEQPPPVPQWPAPSANVSRQPSISETDNDRPLSFVPSAATLSHNFSSPPQTPMYTQQQFVQQRIAGNFVIENTPPQSAPASQPYFQANPYQMQQAQSQATLQQQVAGFSPAQLQHSMNMNPEQRLQMQSMVFAPIPQFAPAAGDIPMQFPHGVPIVNDNGQLQMAFPPQLQLAPTQQHGSQMASPAHPHFSQFSVAGSSPDAGRSKRTASTTAELIVNEYSPPEDVKRAAAASMPRKPMDPGPKNWAFANQYPEDFGKGKKSGDGKASTTTSNSPDSSSGAASS